MNIKNVYTESWNRSVDESVDFIQKHIHSALLFQGIKDIREYAINNISDDGLVLEFGVFQGETINFFRERLDERRDQRRIYGFDAFKGLIEDWTGHKYKKLNRFDLKGKLPEVLPGIDLVEGWVHETLPVFLREHTEKVSFLHIDTDTYQPAYHILKNCKDRLTKGSLILFDEFHSYPNWRNHEAKALNEIFAEEEYEFIAFATYQALIRIKG